VDGQPQRWRGRIGVLRPDVGRALPDYPGSRYSGFRIRLEPSPAAGPHLLELIGIDPAGRRLKITAQLRCL
jgi:hypothetical protein